MSESLDSALARIRQALERHAARADDSSAPSHEVTAAEPVPQNTSETPSRLAMVGARFGLSPFERDVLVLCAGVELDAAFAPLCAKAQAAPDSDFPSFGLALAAFENRDWQALLPHAPLRHWHLVHLTPGVGLTAAELRIDERILHLLLGLDSPDQMLEGVVEAVTPPRDLTPTHRRIAERIAAIWSEAASDALWPVIQLCGSAASSKRAIAATASALLGHRLLRLPTEALPSAPDALDEMIRRWRRESMLTRAALLIDAHDALDDPTVHNRIRHFIERAGSPLLISHHRKLRPSTRASLVIEVDKPETSERRQIWQSAVGPDVSTATIEPLVTQFHLESDEIGRCVLAARGAMTVGSGNGETRDFGNALWTACREQARPGLDDLASRVPLRATWDDLVLPEAQTRQLREVAAQMRYRGIVNDQWGFAATSGRGLGVSALLAGTSGTGKTLAAEVLASDLDLDLYHIDLSSVISKYIGETEKNLRQVFDAAEEGGAVLLFDEADALFGKRSDVKDSHDRYANIEISYLLQRVESYRGLAILTTNFKEALDAAFLRRLRFVVEFRFPDPIERARMWRRVFPKQTPTEGLDIERLARLDLTGGNIRSISLAAAFLAARDQRAIRMEDLRVAVHREMQKLGKSLSESETRDWRS